MGVVVVVVVVFVVVVVVVPVVVVRTTQCKLSVRVRPDPCSSRLTVIFPWAGWCQLLLVASPWAKMPRLLLVKTCEVAAIDSFLIRISFQFEFSSCAAWL